MTHLEQKKGSFMWNHCKNSNLQVNLLVYECFPLSDVWLFCWLIPGCSTISGDTTTWKRSCTMRTWGVHISRHCLTSSEASSLWPITRILLFQSSSHPWIRDKQSLRASCTQKCLKKTYRRKCLHNEPLIVYYIKLFCTELWLCVFYFILPWSRCADGRGEGAHE